MNCKRIAKCIADIAVIAVFAGVLLILIVEWAAGCGESYIDAKGMRHQYECVFIPQSK